MYFLLLIMYFSVWLVEIWFFSGYLVKDRPVLVAEHAKKKKKTQVKIRSQKSYRKKESAYCNWMITYIKS